MRPDTAHQLILLGLFVGLAFSLFSAYETLVPGARGLCTVNSFVSCAAVDQSAHSSTLGIPDWAIGIAGYVAMLALDIPLYRSWKRPLLLALTGLSALGVAVSLYFAYVSLVVIQALCLICLGAYLSNAFVLAFALYLVRLGKGPTRPVPEVDPSAA